MPVSYTERRQPENKRVGRDATRRSSVMWEERGSEWQRPLLHAEVPVMLLHMQSCMFPAPVFSRGQTGLYLSESKSTLRISNYLIEVKRSVSRAHSTSLIYYALIPVNSLARIGEHMWRLRAVQNQANKLLSEIRKINFCLFPKNEILIPSPSSNYITAITRLCHTSLDIYDLINGINNSKKRKRHIVLVSCAFVLFCIHLTQRISASAVPLASQPDILYIPIKGYFGDES